VNLKTNSMKKGLASRYGASQYLQNRALTVLRGQRSVTVYGCKKILLYSPCEIRLCVEKKELSILGEALICTCFSAGSVTVEGRIHGVVYRGCNREKERAEQ